MSRRTAAGNRDPKMKPLLPALCRAWPSGHLICDVMRAVSCRMDRRHVGLNAGLFAANTRSRRNTTVSTGTLTAGAEATAAVNRASLAFAGSDAEGSVGRRERALGFVARARGLTTPEDELLVPLALSRVPAPRRPPRVGEAALPLMNGLSWCAAHDAGGYPYGVQPASACSPARGEVPS